MDLEPFFTASPAGLVPGPHAAGPWAPDMLHGRLLAGLAARAIEAQHGDPAYLMTRLTVDLFRSPPMAPIQVATVLVREGHRVRAADASLTSEGKEVARARALMLRLSPEPEGQVWQPARWDVPLPDDIPIPPGDPGSITSFDMRPITAGGFGAFEQRRTWLRERRLLVGDEPLTPLVRAATAADFTNPFANSGEAGLAYINADLTVFLYRLPVGEWVGFEVADQGSADGVAVGQCTLYDVTGAFGQCTVCGVATPRLVPG